MKKVLFIVGSLRKDSFNRKLAEQAAAHLNGRAAVEFLDYSDLPFMNQDIEHPTPEAVAKVRRAAMAADGIWIFTPEYNYHIPGVLKNLLDWLSRPLDPKSGERTSAVTGKAVTISSAAGKSAGAGARKNLSTLLEIMSMKVISGTGTGVILDGEAFATGKLALSENSAGDLRVQAETFLAAL